MVKTKIKIVILDDVYEDSKELADIIRDLLKGGPYENVTIDILTTPKPLLSPQKSFEYDLILVDIYLINANGIDVAKIIRQNNPNCKLAFCTGSNEYAAESYEVDAVFYLLKPYSVHKVKKLLEKTGFMGVYKENEIFFPDGFVVFPNQIISTEYQNRVVNIYLKDAPFHKISIRQYDMEKLLLNDTRFFSPIKGVIINLDNVISYENGVFTTSDLKKYYVTRTKKKEAKKIFLSYRMKKIKESFS